MDQKQDTTYEEREGGNSGASILASWFNLSNTILGAGVLALAHVVGECGLIIGPILMLLGSMGAMFGLWLLVRTAVWTGKQKTSYFVLAQETFPKSRYIIDLGVAIKCTGVATAYLMIIGARVPSILEQFKVTNSLLLDRRLWVCVGMVPAVPLGLQRELRSLRFVSLGALLTVAYLVVLVLFAFFHYPPEDDSKNHWDDVLKQQELKPVSSLKVLQNLPVIVFAYTCHQNIFSIHSEQHRPTLKKTSVVIGLSVGCCLLTYMIVGILGFMTFPEHARTKEGDDLLSDSMMPISTATTIGRVGIALLALFSYPLQIHPAKVSLDNLLFGSTTVYKATPQDIEITEKRRRIIAVILMAVTFALSIVVDSLGIVLAFVGGTASTTLCYILPGIFYVKMARDRQKQARGGFTSHASTTEIEMLDVAHQPNDQGREQGLLGDDDEMRADQAHDVTGKDDPPKQALVVLGWVMLAIGVVMVVVANTVTVMKLVAPGNSASAGGH
eukprot:TRINITY_DN66956_c3_g1_i1.p1 TRINITY_DN66956_c3_g1~~TRINITY_DN66956_c3_g1_i1.p1  ORF type:complete len:499 (-),score=27.78 TRINITY_DN66956_c3_g1_i1:1287-2783(-)